MSHGTIYKKLAEARLKIHSEPLKKSGKNSHAGYNYFELADFMPSTVRIFAELGLIGCVSFSDTAATLSIYDTESGAEPLVFSTPIAAAALRGCQPIQNLGAQHTYLRRYLWVLALELVESDAVDAAPQSADSADVDAAPVDHNPYWGDAARKAASGGIGEYQAWFAKQPPMLRKLVSGHTMHAELKRVAANVDGQHGANE